MAPQQPLLLGSILALAGVFPAGSAGWPQAAPPVAPQASAGEQALGAARELWDQGQREQAVESLRLRRAAPGVGPEELRQLALWCFEIHRLEQCLETLDQLQQDPDRLRGRTLVRLHRYAEALELLGQGSSAELLARLEAQEALGLFQEWDKELAAAAELLGAQHPEVLRRRGRLALDAGRLEEAIAHFEATLRQEPSAAPALFGLGQALLRSGREEQGLAKLAEHRRLVTLLDELEFAQRSLDLAPRHGPNWGALGDAQRRMGQPQQALLAYNRGLELTDGEQHITILLRAARVEEEDLLKPDLALQRLEQALLKQPDPRLMVRASDVALRSGNLERAQQHLDAALAQRPKDAALLERRAALEKARQGLK